MLPLKNAVLWFSGLSGAGKTTLANGLQDNLHTKGYQVVVLDGDIVRQYLSKDLGFSAEDRTENLRRIANASRDIAQYGVLVISAAISPYQQHRFLAQDILGKMYHGIYINSSLEHCEQRDPKGLYAKVREGEIKQFTGITDPFETPNEETASLVIDTEQLSVSQSLDMIESYLRNKHIIS